MSDPGRTPLCLELRSVVETGLSDMSDETRERLFSESVRTVVREVVRLSDAGVDRLVSRRTASSGTLLAELASVALETDARARTLTPGEKLARANLKGIRALRALLAEHGGCYSASEVADLLGISRQAVHKRTRSEQLLTVHEGEHRVYPVWQFHGGTTVPGLGAVLRALDTESAVARIRFFLAPHARLGDRTALEALRAGDEQAVLETARRFGRHGAD